MPDPSSPGSNNATYTSSEEAMNTFDPVAAVQQASQNMEQVVASARAVEDVSTVRQDDLRIQFCV
jgi:hypothetical protein